MPSAKPRALIAAVEMVAAFVAGKRDQVGRLALNAAFESMTENVRMKLPMQEELVQSQPSRKNQGGRWMRAW